MYKTLFPFFDLDLYPTVINVPGHEYLFVRSWKTEMEKIYCII